MVVLHEVHIQACGFLEVLLVKAFEEEASVIPEDLRFKKQHFW